MDEIDFVEALGYPLFIMDDSVEYFLWSTCLIYDQFSTDV
jgi:hypothetical protein